MQITVQTLSIRNDGFGTAGRQINKSIERIAPTIVSDAEVNFNFCHPHWGRYSDTKYDILYFPWESSRPNDGWIKHLDGFDEVWVTSPWLQETVLGWGFESFVYEHGVDPIWSSALRESPVSGPFKFLMIGFEALRKGGWEAIHAFRRAFGNDPSVELVIKTQSRGMDNVNVFPNVKFITEDLSLKDLVKLYHECHVMIAPTYGEGFGIPARDALATGMPTIATEGFLPYENFIHRDLLIPSTVIDSPWPESHPGKMYRPDVDSLVDQIRDVRENFDYFARYSAYEAKYIHQKYNWDSLTKESFFALGERLG